MAEENKLFDVEIITPDRIFHTGQADMIEFNTTNGEIGVYKMHVPTTTVLAPGIVRMHKDGQITEAAVHAGFAEILPEKVTLLAEIAEWPDEIDEKRAEEAKQRAEERLAAKSADLDVARAEYALHKALVRIELKR
ncbi:MAG: ATP synthase F1 subunit epsilon [Lachnospiraceae bacterium]